MRNSNWFIVLLVGWSIGCASSEIQPVDIFSEDMCSSCRMAISERQFAGEIITKDREVYKFDDIGCMEEFIEKAEDLKIAARFLTDLESKRWIPLEKSTIVQTSMKTPMGSGKVAFADSARAVEFANIHPSSQAKNTDHSCCSEKNE